ncbi:MAG: Ig-like domain-containing protein [Opitutae bacterium]|nr:Ig-like domain-containing protein [Opitutae bacterium]
MKITGPSPRSSVWLAFLAAMAVFLALARPLFAAKQPYAVTIAAPANNTTVTAGTAVTFTATTSGNTSPIAKIDFYDMLSGTIVGTATSAPYSITWTPPRLGNNFVRATATDTNGVKANSAITTVVVSGTTTPPPDGGGGTPPPSTYTVTVLNGTVNGAASATFAPYATVTIVAGAAPAGQAFKQWSGGVAFSDTLATTTTFQMPSANVSITANFYTPPPLPTPVAGHPRLWLNQNDVPRLRSWAHSGNALYQQGLRSMLQLALHAHQLCFPDGVHAAVPYPDWGDNDGYSGANVTTNMVSEQHALTLAFFGLVDPDPLARVSYAQKARQMFMYVINEAAKGHQQGAPFRESLYPIYNRSNGSGECWPLLADWLQGVSDANGQPVTILTAQDKAAIRTAFLLWAEDCLNAYTTGGDHPNPIGVTNSTALLPGGNAPRIAANNYYLNHARLITMMPLALDAADDPALDPTKPDAVRGNTLRSYLLNATGAWLYQQYAMFEAPATVRSAFKLPATATVGLASGGIAVEGGLYGHSIAYIQGQLLALQTAGMTDSAVFGPQIDLIGSPTWDRYVHGFYSTMVPKQQVPASQPYLGPVYQIASVGDLLRLWVTPDNMTTYTLLALNEQKRGLNTHLNDARWIALHAVEGGAAGLINRVQRAWNVTEAILYFMLFDPTDPTALNPADPRTARATAFIDPGFGRLLARTDWTPNATLFDFRAGWSTINHQDCDAGQFQLYRRGEWLTKEFSSYDNNTNGQSSIWHNTLALKNWCSDGTPFLQHFESSYFVNGSQFNNGMSAGDPVTAMSTGPGYAYASTDLTKCYNRPSVWTPGNALMDISHASRAIVWLQPDVAVIYDRAASVHTGLFKRFNLTLTAPPTIDGTNRRATVVTPGGQYLFVNTLLPTNATLSYVPVNGTITNIAELEPSIGRLVVEDSSNPTTIRFLHVLQAADTAGARLTPTPLASTAGDAFSGAVVGTDVALFAVNYGTPFAGTSYTAPLATQKHYLSGLAPGARYSVLAAANGASADIVIQPSATGAFTADTAGLLVFDLTAALQ